MCRRSTDDDCDASSQYCEEGAHFQRQSLRVVARVPAAVSLLDLSGGTRCQATSGIATSATRGSHPLVSADVKQAASERTPIPAFAITELKRLKREQPKKGCSEVSAKPAKRWFAACRWQAFAAAKLDAPIHPANDSDTGHAASSLPRPTHSHATRLCLAASTQRLPNSALGRPASLKMQGEAAAGLDQVW